MREAKINEKDWERDLVQEWMREWPEGEEGQRGEEEGEPEDDGHGNAVEVEDAGDD